MPKRLAMQSNTLQDNTRSRQHSLNGDISKRERQLRKTSRAMRGCVGMRAEAHDQASSMT